MFTYEHHEVLDIFSITKKNKHEDFIYSGNINELIKSLAGQDIIDITIEEPSLEETFMNYY